MRIRPGDGGHWEEHRLAEVTRASDESEDSEFKVGFRRSSDPDEHRCVRSVKPNTSMSGEIT